MISSECKVCGNSIVRAGDREYSWEPACQCGAPVKPSVVLDPFFGAGTTGLVAQRLGRDYIGIELNPEYAKLAKDRIESQAPLFSEGRTA